MGGIRFLEGFLITDLRITDCSRNRWDDHLYRTVQYLVSEFLEGIWNSNYHMGGRVTSCVNCYPGLLHESSNRHCWLGTACSRDLFLALPMRSRRIWPKEKTLQMRYTVNHPIETHHSLRSVETKDQYSYQTLLQSLLSIKKLKLTATGIRARVSRGRRLDEEENTEGNSPMQPRQLQINEQSEDYSNDNMSRSPDGDDGGLRGSTSGWERSHIIMCTSGYFLAKII